MFTLAMVYFRFRLFSRSTGIHTASRNRVSPVRIAGISHCSITVPLPDDLQVATFDQACHGGVIDVDLQTVTTAQVTKRHRRLHLIHWPAPTLRCPRT